MDNEWYKTRETAQTALEYQIKQIELDSHRLSERLNNSEKQAAAASRRFKACLEKFKTTGSNHSLTARVAYENCRNLLKSLKKEHEEINIIKSFGEKLKGELKSLQSKKSLEENKVSIISDSLKDAKQKKTAILYENQIEELLTTKTVITQNHTNPSDISNGTYRFKSEKLAVDGIADNSIQLDDIENSSKFDSANSSLKNATEAIVKNNAEQFEQQLVKSTFGEKKDHNHHSENKGQGIISTKNKLVPHEQQLQHWQDCIREVTYDAGKDTSSLYLHFKASNGELLKVKIKENLNKSVYIEIFSGSENSRKTIKQESVTLVKKMKAAGLNVLGVKVLFRPTGEL